MHHFQIDDPVDAAAIHLGCGTWGLLAVGLFAHTPQGALPVPGVEGLFRHGGFHTLGIQLLGCVVLIAFSAVMTALALALIRAAVGLRVTELEERMGLDAAEHRIL